MTHGALSNMRPTARKHRTVFGQLDHLGQQCRERLNLLRGITSRSPAQRTHSGQRPHPGSVKLAASTMAPHCAT
jgi:hypothetical protein